MEIVKRDDSDFELTFTDVDGAIIDLTDCTVFFTVKKYKDDDDEDALIAKEITSFEHPTTGVVILALTHDETDMAAGDYWFDLQLKNKNGQISSSSAGRFIVTQDITIRTVDGIS
jgi:hypothetical protein